MQMLLVVPFLMSIALVVGGGVTDNQTMITIGAVLIGVTVLIFLVIKFGEMSHAQEERKRIWKEGRAATARVIAITEAPGSAEDHPEVDLDLEVRVDGAPPVPGKVRSLISRLAIPRIQPGSEIQVKVDPADAKKIVIDPALTPYRKD